ncbi:MAG: sulfur oxidation c-type cytochrome SoxX [Enterobacterales bacterium]|nr:sulfur oxidation c-type cytochrome SoxX [Enterobacterales bacterium]
MKGTRILLSSLLVTVIAAFSSITLAQESGLSAELAQGKAIAFDRRKGNCLACHYIQGGALMGTTGPGLVAMKQRFPDRQRLITQVTDARLNNKNTIMPPFGAHGI